MFTYIIKYPCKSGQFGHFHPILQSIKISFLVAFAFKKMAVAINDSASPKYSFLICSVIKMFLTLPFSVNIFSFCTRRTIDQSKRKTISYIMKHAIRAEVSYFVIETECLKHSSQHNQTPSTFYSRFMTLNNKKIIPVIYVVKNNSGL